MKHVVVALVFVLCSSLPLAAHDHSVDLKAGQWVLGLDPHGESDLVTYDGFYDTVDGIAVTYYHNIVNAMPNTSSPYGDFSAEVGVSDGWSLGLKSTGLGGLVVGIRDGLWNIPASVFSNLRLTDTLGLHDSGWDLFWYQEVQIRPLVKLHFENGDGSINVYTSFSLNRRLIDIDGFAFSAYVDSKFTSNFLNPFSKPPRWLDRDWAVYFFETFGIPYSSDFEFKLIPTSSAFVAVGFEMTLGRAVNLSVGTNVPLGTLIGIGKDTTKWDMWELDTWDPLRGIEMQLKWVL